jgi:hypothetical protein
MNREFIPYEQALALKELGFGEKCYGHYDSIGELNTIEDYARLGANISDMISKEFNSVSYIKEMCSAPLYQQAFRWFREKYDLHAYVDSMRLTTGETVYDYVITITDGEDSDDGKNWRTYEEAEQACLNKLIELVKNK